MWMLSCTLNVILGIGMGALKRKVNACFDDDYLAELLLERALLKWM